MIINNLKQDQSSKNHFEIMQTLFAQSDEVVITSPFLSEDIKSLLGDLNSARTIKTIVLITVVESFRQKVLQPIRLMALIDYCKTEGITLRMRLDEGKDYCLHGKVYLFYKNSNPIDGIVTSANFTRTGLTVNHEYGVLLSMANSFGFRNEIEKLKNWLINNSRLIIEEQIMIIYDQVKSISNPVSEDPAPNVDAAIVLKREVQANKQYILKPLGSGDSHINMKDIYWMDERQFFSRKHNSLAVDDIVIDYAVTDNSMSHPIIGIFRLTNSEFIIDNSFGDRWPHYKESKNLVTSYTKKVCSSFFITLEDCEREFNKMYPNAMIKTGKTGKDFNNKMPSLTTQCDHLFVSYEFACYVESRLRSF